MCFTGTYAALELAERRHIGYTALLAVNTVILVLAGGRMALGMGFLVCGIAYLRSFQRFPLLKIFLPIWFVVIGGILLVSFGQDNLRHLGSTSLSNRDLIWAALMRHLHAHPWFGVGLGNQQLLVPESLTGKTGTFAGHNEYLRITVELGYPGAALFFALTLGIFLLVWNSAWVRRDPMFLVCAAAFYIYGLTDNTFSVPQAYFILAAASFACQRPAIAATPDALANPSPQAAAPVSLRGSS
jgi:O-antigen ligase